MNEFYYSLYICVESCAGEIFTQEVITQEAKRITELSHNKC
ncbi:hypothetical protein HMPREF9530_04760 [Escherichia coli MS 21-1]|nr:hypothetical protein HMPREF9530_04760 [Escherichia coli MS 21-1]